MKFIHTTVSILSIAAMAAAAVSCGKTEETTAAAETQAEEIPAVTVMKVTEQEVRQTATYTATVEAFKTNNIATSTPNRIKRILVEVGARVAAGQKVVELDDVNIEQLRVRLENTERDYNRAVKLLEIGGGTQQSVDQLKTELDAARRQYTNMLENTVLTSPISGVVTARNYDPGDMTGQLPILTIEQIQPVKVLINVSETEFTKVKKGMEAKVTFDTYGEELFTGRVYLIHPSIDPSTRTFTVEITIDNPGDRILPGMFARVELDFGAAMHVVVPDRALVKQSGSGNRYVYVFNPADSTVSFNRVETGLRVGDAYEIISGVADGADVVTSGQTRLADGIKVEILK